MKVSRNELLALTGRALEGVGCYQGDWQDAAAATVWAEMCGLEGLARLAEALPGLEEGVHLSLVTCSETATRLELDAQHGSCLVRAPLAVDLLYVKALESELVTGSLKNCQTRSSVGWSLLTLARRNMHCLAHWYTRAQPQQHCVMSAAANENALRVEVFDDDGRSSSGADDSNLQLVCSGSAAMLAEYRFSLAQGLAPVAAVTQEQQRQSYAGCLEHGIEVADPLWRQLGRLADNVLVEDTDSSRERGAGPG